MSSTTGTGAAATIDATTCVHQLEQVLRTTLAQAPCIHPRAQEQRGDAHNSAQAQCSPRGMLVLRAPTGASEMYTTTCAGAASTVGAGAKCSSTGVSNVRRCWCDVLHH